MEEYLIIFRRYLMFIALATGSIPGLVWIFKHRVEKFMLWLFPPDEYDALVTAKRLEVKSKDKEAYSTYYITFEYSLGKRAEHKIKKEVYALNAEGDRGTLCLRQDKFVSFERRC